MDWTNYILDERFTGRQKELDVLAREIIGPDPNVVAITGAPGAGKTALAMMFAHIYRDAFPAGAYHVHATPFETLLNSVSASVSNPSSPYLLILDDLESRQPQQQLEEILQLRRSRPSARLICISRIHSWQGQADLTLELGNLNHAEVEELIRKLGVSQSGLNEASQLLQSINGHPLALTLIADLLRSSSRTPRELWQYLQSFSYSGLVDVTGKPLSSNGIEERQIIVDVTHANEEFLKKVYENPSLLYDLSPRRFEEFVAEILDRLGYEITLTPATNDGGKDIYAAKKDDLGSFLYVVECKKYAPENHVGVGLIRQLNGVVQAERATAGILATTSFFTKGAKELQARLSNQISLKDYLGIQEWLNKVFKNNA
ncbi:MAG: restriction endonuclease [Candidatus Thiodiazotropha taylori]|nr:restriction endonuclease [Candidatus Thiodiazotropha taylori]MCW4327259.1 restriction endonuclease [Candidatus Thiodiazotropha taylori]